MLQVHVLVPEKPEMLWEIVLKLLRHERQLRVTVGKDENSLPRMARSEIPDIVVVELRDDHVPTAWKHIVEERTRTKVLALKAQGRRAYLYELFPHTTPLGELSPEDLVRVIRDAPGASASFLGRT